MLNFIKKIFSDNNSINLETNELLKQLRFDQEHRFNEIKSRFENLELALKELETKLITKDIKDRQAYGQLYYKLHEVKASTNDEELLATKLKKVQN
jgi:hypothetical protein